MLDSGACNETRVLGDCHPLGCLEMAYYRHDTTSNAGVRNATQASLVLFYFLPAGYRLFISLYSDTLDLTLAIAQVSLENALRVALFSNRFDLAKRNLHVCTMRRSRVNEK